MCVCVEIFCVCVCMYVGVGTYEACHRAWGCLYGGCYPQSKVQGAGWSRDTEGWCPLVRGECGLGQSTLEQAILTASNYLFYFPMPMCKINVLLILCSVN